MGILLLALLHNPIQAFSVTIPTTASVTLTWDPSTSPAVTGYRVHYGATSGQYTDSVAVGNIATGTVPGLTSGLTYYFAVTAFDANGLESDSSNEISYTVPGGSSTLQVGMTSSRQMNLTVTGQVGRIYDILATQDFTTWNVIGSVTMEVSGSLGFTDTNAASYPSRFYRTQERP